MNATNRIHSTRVPDPRTLEPRLTDRDVDEIVVRIEAAINANRQRLKEWFWKRIDSLPRRCLSYRPTTDDDFENCVHLRFNETERNWVFQCFQQIRTYAQNHQGEIVFEEHFDTILEKHKDSTWDSYWKSHWFESFSTDQFDDLFKLVVSSHNLSVYKEIARMLKREIPIASCFGFQCLFPEVQARRELLKQDIIDIWDLPEFPKLIDVQAALGEAYWERAWHMVSFRDLGYSPGHGLSAYGVIRNGADKVVAYDVLARVRQHREAWHESRLRKIRWEERRKREEAKEDEKRKREEVKVAKEERVKAAAAAHFEKSRTLAKSVRRHIRNQEEIVTGCPYCCGELGDAPVADHIYPVAKRGLSTVANMVYVCSDCNSAKSDKTLREFAKAKGMDWSRIERNLEALRKDF